MACIIRARASSLGRELRQLPLVEMLEQLERLAELAAGREELGLLGHRPHLDVAELVVGAGAHAAVEGVLRAGQVVLVAPQPSRVSQGSAASSGAASVRSTRANRSSASCARPTAR